MKPFRFRLERVKKVRASQEKQKVQELSVEMRTLEVEGARLQNLLNKRSEVFAELDEVQNNPRHSDEILTYCSYINMLNRDIEQQRRKMATIQKGIDRTQLELVEASKGKKVLEKLREHQYLRYLLQSNREEQKLLDEIALLTRQFREML